MNTTRCNLCTGESTLKEMDYRYTDPFVGDVVIPGALIYQCQQCQSVMIPMNIAREISDAVSLKLENFLRRKPIEDFISAVDLAEEFDISKAALLKKKSRYLRKIFSLQRGRNRSYEFYRPSVDLFVSLGDGRFEIAPRAAVDNHERLPNLQFSTPAFGKIYSSDALRETIRIRPRSPVVSDSARRQQSKFSFTPCRGS